MGKKQQVDFLQRLFKTDVVAKRVFERFAARQQHRVVSYVTRTARQVGVSEAEIKEFFRALEGEGFGKYIKSSKGGNARFEWGTQRKGYELDYSLIAVGRVATGEDTPLDGYLDNPEGIDEEDDDLEAPENRVMTIRTEFKGVRIRVDLPANFDPKADAEEFKDLISMLVRHKRR